MCKLCWTLFTLLVLTTAGITYQVVVLGNVETAPDGRVALQLTQQERNLVLSEMRDFLTAVQKIIDATNRQEMQAAAAAARKVGMAAQTSVPPGLIAKLPLEFKQLGFDTHRKFDALALDAEQLGDPDHTRNELSSLMANCIACHAAYSLVLDNPSR